MVKSTGSASVAIATKSTPKLKYVSSLKFKDKRYKDVKFLGENALNESFKVELVNIDKTPLANRQFFVMKNLFKW